MHMKTGIPFKLEGCVTQAKYIQGRSLTLVERILGYQLGRLSKGLFVVAANRLPEDEEFDLQGYTQVSSDRFQGTGNLEVNRLKALARANWSLYGPNRLVKVYPSIRHDPNIKSEDQYPPGAGAPQWYITQPIEGKVIYSTDQYKTKLIFTNS